MALDTPTVYFLGPPAAGKTTIARTIAARLGQQFRTIDDWTPRGQPMTDAQVQLALEKLFEVTQPTNEIVEFCHHDYDDLARSSNYSNFADAPKVLVLASLETCQGRNQRRRSPVRDEYVERAWRSAQQFARDEGMRRPDRTLVIDTDRMPESDAMALASEFLLTQRRSQ